MTEQEYSRTDFDAASLQVDTDTRFMAGSYERQCSYQELASRGMAVLPHLVDDMRSERSHGYWWRMQMINGIAQSALNQNIIYPASFSREDARNRVVEWWDSIKDTAVEQV